MQEVASSRMGDIPPTGRRHLATRTTRDDAGEKTYHIDAFENDRGKAMRLTEVVKGRRNSVIISKEFYDKLMELADEVADESFEDTKE